MTTVLVVDDDAVSRLVLCHMLRTRGWAVDQAADVPEALTAMARTAYDVVVSDFHLPSGTGVDVLAGAEASATLPSFVLVTGVIEHSSLPTAIEKRVAAQLTKPVSSASLDAALQRLAMTSRP